MNEARSELRPTWRAEPVARQGEVGREDITRNCWLRLVK